MRAIVVLGLVAALAGRAVAERDPAVAKRLFAEGRTLYDQGKFIEACLLFDKSFELDPAVGTKLNLAECAERENKPRAAWLLWTSAAEEFERKSDKRSKFARARADALAPKLATVVARVIRPKQKGLTIQIAGRDVAPAEEIIERAEPGTIVVTARAPERETFETTVTVGLGGKASVEIPSLAKLGGEGPDLEPDEVEPRPVPEQPRAQPPSPSRNWWKVGAIAGGAITALAAGGYVYSALQIKRVEGDLEDEMASSPVDFARINALNTEGFDWQSRARIMLGVTAGAAVVTTLVFLKARSVERRAIVTPVITSQTAGAQLLVRW
jgi:tetratricopeptide (TPR) repeat protein